MLSFYQFIYEKSGKLISNIYLIFQSGSVLSRGSYNKWTKRQSTWKKMETFQFLKKTNSSY